MPRNQKLTKVIAGRTVKVATVEYGRFFVINAAARGSDLLGR
jgi:hypothetical protein